MCTVECIHKTVIVLLYEIYVCTLSFPIDLFTYLVYWKDGNHYESPR